MGIEIDSWRFALERRLRGMPPLTVTREEAIARAVEAWEGHPGTVSQAEKPSAVEELGGWLVWLRTGTKPCPWIWIDGQTGEPSGDWLTRDRSVIVL